MTAPGRAAAIGSFAALGDSFTEGLNDPGPGGGYRGWADRFAEILAATNPGLRYANLAVRGKMLGEVVAEQVPAALALAPDLVSMAAGGNDLLRPSADPDGLAATFDGAVARLRGAGCQVLVLTGFDPRTFPVIRWIRSKVAIYNMHLRGIADRHGCIVVDLWSMPVLCDPRVWSDDRLHLTAEGHRRVALRACEAIGAPGTEVIGAGAVGAGAVGTGAAAAEAPGTGAAWDEPLATPAGAAIPAPAGWLAARQVDARWARQHAAPWVRRRIRGVSSGDGVLPKRPELLPLDGLMPVDG
jgi:lysophospholipase L1-like esterase